MLRHSVTSQSLLKAAMVNQCICCKAKVGAEGKNGRFASEQDWSESKSRLGTANIYYRHKSICDSCRLVNKGWGLQKQNSQLLASRNEEITHSVADCAAWNAVLKHLQAFDKKRPPLTCDKCIRLLQIAYEIICSCQRGSETKNAILGLFAKVISFQQMAEEFRISYSTIVHAKQWLSGFLNKNNTSPQPEIAERRVDRKQKSSGVPYSQLFAEARKIFEREDLSELRGWVRKENNQLEYMLVGKASIDRIYQEYVKECSQQEERKPVSLTSFYEHCIPENFVYDRFQNCCCSRCKHGMEAINKLKAFVRYLKSAEQKIRSNNKHLQESEYFGQRRKMLNEMQDLLLRFEYHANFIIQSETYKSNHPSIFIEQLSYNLFNEEQQQLMSLLTKQYKRGILQIACQQQDLSKSGNKSELVQKIMANAVRETGEGVEAKCVHCAQIYKAYQQMCDFINTSTGQSVQSVLSNILPVGDAADIDEASCVRALLRYLRCNIIAISEYVDHKYESGWQDRQLDFALEGLNSKEEVWIYDWGSSISAYQSLHQSQTEDMATEHINNFVVCRYSKEDNTGIIKKHNHILLTTYYTHDSYANQCMLDLMFQEAKERSVQKIVAFSDNGTSFHCAKQLQWLAAATTTGEYKVNYIQNYFAPGEGKSDCDRTIGRMKKHIKQYLRNGKELRGDINHVADALARMDNSTVYIIAIEGNINTTCNCQLDSSDITKSSGKPEVEIIPTKTSSKLSLPISQCRQIEFTSATDLRARKVSNFGEWQQYKMKIPPKKHIIAEAGQNYHYKIKQNFDISTDQCTETVLGKTEKEAFKVTIVKTRVKDPEVQRATLRYTLKRKQENPCNSYHEVLTQSKKKQKLGQKKRKVKRDMRMFSSRAFIRRTAV